jgi:putative redox protein
MPAQIDLTYTGAMRCTARLISSGKTLATDLPESQGGLGEGVSPSDLLVVSLGTCIVTTMAMVAQRHNIDLSGMSACIDKDMTTTPVRRVGPIGVTISMPMGLHLSPEDMQRLENAAARCPVKQSLHPDIEVRVEFVYPRENG